MLHTCNAFNNIFNLNQISLKNSTNSPSIKNLYKPKSRMSEIRGHFLKFTLTGDITPIFTFENEDEQLTGGVREKISEFLNTFQQQFFNETKKELQKMMFGQNNNEIKSVDGMIELLEGQI